MGDSSYTEYKSGTTDSSDTAGWEANLSFGKDFTFAKPAYTGTIDAPTVKTNAGGKVVLDAVTPTGGPGGETVQYGYSNSASTVPTTWQDSTTFDSLTVGSTYYFYAKVVETATYAEKVSAASGKVIVADKTLTNLEITTQPSTKTYTHGDPFKADGMKVKAIYDDGSSDPAFTDYTVAYQTSGKNYLCMGNNKVTLKAGSESVEVTGLSVGAKELTVTDLTAVNREYKPGDISVTLTGGKLNGVVSGEKVTLDTLPTGSITSADVGNDKNVSFAALTISGADAGNYTLTQPTGIKVNITTKNINGANITLNTAPTYDGTEKQVTISGVTVDGSPLNTGDYDIVADTNKATNVESKELKITGKGNYMGTATKNWLLQKATPDVGDFDLTSLSAPVDYTGNPNGVTAPTLKSGKTDAGTVTVYYEGTSGTTYSKDTNPPTEVGTYAVTFDVAGGKNFNTASDLIYGTLTIQAKDVSDTRAAENQTVVKDVGDFTPPNFGAVTGALTYTYESSTKTYEEIKAALAAKSAGESAIIHYSYAANGNYTGTITGSINVSVVDVSFEVGGVPATVANTLTFKTNPTYGDDWSEIVKIKDGVTITAKVGTNTDTVQSHFTLKQTGKPGAGSQAYTLSYNGTINGVTYSDVTVVSGNVDVAQKEVTVSGITASSKPYDGNTNATVNASTATITGKVDGDDLTVSVATGSIFDNADAGSRTVTLGTLTLGGTSAANYTLAASGNQTTATARITARDLTVTPNSGQSKSYGTTPDPVLAYTSTGTVTGEIAAFDGALSRETGEDVGTYNITKGSLALKDSGTFKASNYKLVLDTTAVTFEITKGTYSGSTPTKTVNVLKNYAGAQTGTLTAADFFTTAPAEAKITAVTPVPTTGSMLNTVSVDGHNSLTYTSNTGITATADETYSVTITTKNYNDITATLTFSPVDKTNAGVTISSVPTSKTYGDADFTLTAVKSSADTGGTWSWASSDNTILKIVSGGNTATATVQVLKADTSGATLMVTYDSTTHYGTFTTASIPVAKKAVTVAPKAVSITKGSAIPTFELVYTGLVNGETLTPGTAPTFTCFEADGTTAVSTSTAAGTYTITWTNMAGTTFTGADNYDLTKTATATLTISNPSYSGGGSYTPSYTVSVDKTENGTITVSPKSASKGDTVTITVKPDKGYELDTLKVLDKNGDKVKLTEKNGKYTFTMPTGKVTVKSSFVEEAPVQIFKDVPVDAYYYEAVKWAAEKGITGGVGNGLFAPNQPCTRAQIVTFLWRAAGSPTPKNMSSFTDVPVDAFYAKAVAWAVENGITSGTGDGKFSPDATCTRAQSVTFLYRAAGSPKVSGSAEFGDVATNAYYADAVAWAAKNGITGGIGGGLFGSDNDCTRAQIVTFLYRSVK